MEESAEFFLGHGHYFPVSEKGLAHDLLDLCGIEWVIDPDHRVKPGLERLGLKPLPGGQGLYRNARAFPRAWVIGAGEKRREPGGLASAPGSHYSYGRVSMKALGPGRLVMNDLSFPGWEARVGGEHARIEVWKDFFRSVQVPEGESLVVLRYRPCGFRIGMWLSLISFISLATVLGHARFFGRRNMKDAEMEVLTDGQQG